MHMCDNHDGIRENCTIKMKETIEENTRPSGKINKQN